MVEPLLITIPLEKYLYILIRKPQHPLVKLLLKFIMATGLKCCIYLTSVLNEESCLKYLLDLHLKNFCATKYSHQSYTSAKNLVDLTKTGGKEHITLRSSNSVHC